MLHILKADIITIKKILIDVSSSKDAFLKDVFQMNVTQSAGAVEYTDYTSAEE